MSCKTNKFGRNTITSKSTKLNPRVDLTPMVSISFLLIIFFMLTSYLSKPQVMDLGMPENRGCGGYYGCYMEPYHRTMTLLIGDNDEVVSYFGEFNNPLEEPKSLTFNKNSLRKELINRYSAVVEYTGDPKKVLIVLIKPSKKSNYKNLVDVLDEMAIVRVPTYSVIDITPEEEDLLDRK